MTERSLMMKRAFPVAGVSDFFHCSPQGEAAFEGFICRGEDLSHIFLYHLGLFDMPDELHHQDLTFLFQEVMTLLGEEKGTAHPYQVSTS